MTVSPASGTVAKTRNVTVTIGDTASGLSSSANKTYYLSTSSTNPTASGYKTGNYTSGTAFTIGTGLTGTYYLFLPVIVDNVGNTSVATISGYYRCGTYVFDNSGPNISNVVVDSATKNGFKVTITATDVGTAGMATSNKYTIYYRKGTSGNYSNVVTNTSPYTFTNLDAGSSYQVYVAARDTLGNESNTSSSVKTISTVNPIYTWDVYEAVQGEVSNLTTDNSSGTYDNSAGGTITYWGSTESDAKSRLASNNRF